MQVDCRQTLHLRFSSHWCLNFVELLESQKSSSSIFLVLNGSNKTKKIKKHSRPPNLVRQPLFNQFQQKSNIFLVFHWKFNGLFFFCLFLASTDQLCNQNEYTFWVSYFAPYCRENDLKPRCNYSTIETLSTVSVLVSNANDSKIACFSKMPCVSFCYTLH